MQPQAIEFMTWLGMTYAGALIALPIMELVRKKIKGRKGESE